MANSSNRQPGYASSPCFAKDLELGECGFGLVDPVQSTDVARWRKAERVRLINSRLALSAEQLRIASNNITDSLNRVLQPTSESIISVFWSMRGEPRLQKWMQSVYEKGARVLLPEVVGSGQPLVFREWTPGCLMRRGVWNIPVPKQGAVLTPDVVIAPLVGFDSNNYRLGYGGGYFDRTLAVLSHRSKVIGVGYACNLIPTIFPQPHDIPMDLIVTGDGRIQT